ncbi:hypothetical protein Bca52824_019359 [Brassica carinata]|uniref:Uncharacterized protein n=1 Tax=Brassica carinata TaxID=52824 RepID=A0A8X8AZG9_BRACI|nr:hypothetical protein Bca52824_019359 [Brassica carinata]
MRFGGFGAEETEHHDQATTDQLRFPTPRWMPTRPACNAVCMRRLKKAHDLLNAIPPPPPSRFSKGKNI